MSVAATGIFRVGFLISYDALDLVQENALIRDEAYSSMNV